jgi:histidine triad (HIT) family protein
LFEDKCLFCKIIHRELPADILFETDDILVFNDINPQAPFHILTIPKKHIACISDIEEADAELLGKIIFSAKKVAKDLGIDNGGYRMVFNNGRHGGQDIYHIHLHLLGGRQMRWPPG